GGGPQDARPDHQLRAGPRRHARGLSAQPSGARHQASSTPSTSGGGMLALGAVGSASGTGDSLAPSVAAYASGRGASVDEGEGAPPSRGAGSGGRDGRSAWAEVTQSSRRMRFGWMPRAAAIAATSSSPQAAIWA